MVQDHPRCSNVVQHDRRWSNVVQAKRVSFLSDKSRHTEDVVRRRCTDRAYRAEVHSEGLVGTVTRSMAVRHRSPCIQATAASIPRGCRNGSSQGRQRGDRAATSKARGAGGARTRDWLGVTLGGSWTGRNDEARCPGSSDSPMAPWRAARASQGCV